MMQKTLVIFKLIVFAAILTISNSPVWALTPVTPVVESVQISQQTFGSEVIFHDEFEDGLPLASKYSGYASANGSCDVTSKTGLGGSAHSFMGKWIKGQVDAGSVAYKFGRNPAGTQSHQSMDFREIYWRFYVKTSKGWTGNPEKLTRSTILASSNWSQAMIAHLWGAHDTKLLDLGPATGIDSNNNLITTGYNDFAHLIWLGRGRGVTQIYDPSMSSSWHCIEVHAKLNTPGLSDAVYEYWINGALESRMTGFNWVGTWQTYGINTVLLENYWNNGAENNQERYMDNFVISTKPIGLALSSVNPLIYKSAFEDVTSGHTQGSFNAQVSTSQDISGIVWIGSANGTGNELQVNSTNGKFSGSLAGRTALEGSNVYYVRVSQTDNIGTVSEWSSWRVFKTAAQALNPAPLPPTGVKAKVK